MSENSELNEKIKISRSEKYSDAGKLNIVGEPISPSSIEKELINIIIPVDEYRELLIYKGKYEELKDICNNAMTSPILRPEYTNLYRPKRNYSDGETSVEG